MAKLANKAALTEIIGFKTTFGSLLETAKAYPREASRAIFGLIKRVERSDMSNSESRTVSLSLSPQLDSDRYIIYCAILVIKAFHLEMSNM